MKTKIMWFVIGVIVGTIGLTTLKASSGGDGWTEKDVYRAITLLEKIAENTAR